MAIFGPKPLVNPFGKMSIFGLFELFVFIAQKGVFLFKNIVKDIFLASIAKKEQLEKSPFLDKNHGLTPLEKWEFLDVLNFFFLQLTKAFFRFRMSSKTFCCSILPKTRSWKNGHFWTKTMEKCQFFNFLNFLFLQLRKAFFRSRIS